MKHRAKYAVVALCALLTGFIFSCGDLADLEMPESVTIKSTNARYSVPVGNYAIRLSDQLSAKKLQKKINKSIVNDDESVELTGGMQVYDYNPGGIDTVQEYIIHYPITTISLNPAQYFKDIGLDEKINDGLTQEISIPGTLAFSDTYDFPDFNQYLCDKFKAPPVQLTIAEPGTSDIVTTEMFPVSPEWTMGMPFISLENSPIANQMTLAQEIEIPFTFDAMSLSQGNIVVTVTSQTTESHSDGFQTYLQATLINSRGEEVGGSDHVRIEQEHEIIIPISSSKVLTKTMKIVLSGDLSGGTLNKKHTYLCAVSLSAGAQIKEIYGLSISKEGMGADGEQGITSEISMDSLSDTLKEATIKSGTIRLTAKLPAGWSGIKTESKISLSGGISLFRDKFQNLDPQNATYLLATTAPLDYEKITPANATKVEGTMTMWFENANLVFSDESRTFKLNGNCILQEALEATVYVDKLTQRDEPMEPIEISFSDEMRSYIKRMKFTQFGVDGSLDSELEARDLSVRLEMSSTDLSIPKQVSSANITGESSFLLTTPQNWSKEIDLTESAEYAIDFDYAISGAGGSNETVLASFVFDKTYRLTPRFNLLFDWEYIVINTGAEEMDYAKDIETGLSIGSIFSDFMGGEEEQSYIDLIEQIKFEGIEGYVYVTKPQVKAGFADPLQSFSTFTGTIKAKYAGNDVGDDLIDPATPLEVKQSNVDFASLADEQLMITDSQLLTDANCYSAKTVENVFCNLINQNPKPDDLVFSCDLRLSSAETSELTLYKEQFDNFAASDAESSDVSIKISIALLLPFRLIVEPKDGAEYVDILDVMNFVGHPLEDDLLGRDSAEETSDYEEYISLVRYIQCQYTISNSTGLALTADFTATADGELSPYIRESLSFLSGEHTLNFTRDNVNDMFTKWPFTPKINMHLKKGAVTVPRNAELGLSVVLLAETDGSYEIWSKD